MESFDSFGRCMCSDVCERVNAEADWSIQLEQRGKI